jgi:hypothetical protein
MDSHHLKGAALFSIWQSIHGHLQQVQSQESPLFLITKV